MKAVSCHQVRDRLAAGRTAEPGTPLAGHLASCAACARFAERIGVARRILAEQHGAFEPDEQFANRVTARLRIEPTADLGWAALRVLPATLALLLVLAWLSWQVTPATEARAVSSPTDDLLSWILEPGENGS